MTSGLRLVEVSVFDSKTVNRDRAVETVRVRVRVGARAGVRIRVRERVRDKVEVEVRVRVRVWLGILIEGEVKSHCT